MAKCATGDNGSGEESYGLQAHHALVVRGQTLLAVIPEADLPSGHDKCVDLGGRPVTPGLIDCHTHRCLAAIARRSGSSVSTVSPIRPSAHRGGINATVSATRDSSPENLLTLAQQRLERLMNEGVTTRKSNPATVLTPRLKKNAAGRTPAQPE